MPQDNLTLKLQRELERRHGRAVSQSAVEGFLRSKGMLGDTPSTQPIQPTQTIQQPQPPQPQQQFPWSTPEEEREVKGGALNALGVGLWSALDTAAFGLPGLAVEEEEFLDFEDPMAKYAGALGGFVGFVAGAPMKLGAKAVQLAAKPFIQKTGRESLETVLRSMKRTGKKGGLDKSTIKEVTGGYRTLVKRSQTDAALRAPGKLKDKSFEYMNRFISKGKADGTLTTAQAEAVTEMFGKNINRRPLQDFIGLMAERGIAKNSPRLQRVIGHAINDALMFGMIDTVFEGVSTIEDHEFDWTAPLWGVANGIAFSQLGWLNPKGKSSKWFPDFKAGVRSAFSRNAEALNKATAENLAVRAKFMGESLEANGERYIKNVKFGVKEAEVNLKSDNILKEFQAKFGEVDAEPALRSFLNEQRKEWGKKMMKWSTKEGFQNLQGNWMRMMMGGALFNARTFSEMFLFGAEPDIHDILPHFLIGAYVQRGSNPARFDLNASKMNKVRQNLMFLGFSPRQLSEIPSFAQSGNRFENPFKSPKMKPVEDVMRELGIISESNEVVSVELPKGEVSAMQSPNEMFDAIYAKAKDIGGYIKPKDSISVADMNKVVDAMKKADPTVKSADNLVEAWAEDNLESTKDFERTFQDIIELVRKADENIGNQELDIVNDPTSAKNSQVPHHLSIGPEILKRARKGELDFIKDENGNVLKGDEAVEKLLSVQAGLNNVFDMATALQQTSKMPDTAEKSRNRDILSEELMRSVYKTITESEGRINSEFPQNTSYADKFTFENSFNDYSTVLLHNQAIRAGQKVVDIFSGKDNNTRIKLGSLLEEAGVLELGGDQVLRLRDSIKGLKITKADGEPTSEEVASAKRTLGKVLALQSYSGGYSKVVEAPSSRNIRIERVRALEAFLTENGYPVETLPDWMHSHMVDFIVRDRVKRTELTIDQVDTMFRLQNHAMSGIEVAVEGKTGGFTVRLIDEAVMPGNVSFKPYVQKINQYLKQLISDGKGLVKEGEKIKILDADMLRGIMMEIPSGDVSTSARATLTQFLNALPSQFGSFQRQFGEFIQNGNHDLAVRWLSAAGVLTNAGKRRGEYQIEIKNFNAKFAAEFQKEMSMYGITPEYAERKYAETVKSAKDRFIKESEDGYYDKNITLQEFYGRYRIDGIDYRNEDALVGQEAFNELVYQPPISTVEGQSVQPRRLLHRDAIKNILNRIHVDVGDGVFKKLSELDTEQQQKIKNGEILTDIVGLLASQRSQEKVRVLKYENGKIKETFEVQQFNKFSRLLNETLDIPFFTIDPFATIYENVDGRYIRTRVENIYRSSENINREQRERLDKHRTDFETALEIAQTLNGENTVGENGEQGVKVMVLSPSLPPIGIETRHLTKLENNKIHSEFRRFTNKYGENTNISETIRGRFKEVIESMENPETITSTMEYESAIRQLVFENMLTGKDGNKFYIDFLNGNNTEKVMNRIKLYNTKKFVRANDVFLRDVAEGYREIGDTKTDEVIRRIIRNEGFGVSIWNDEGYSTVKAEVEKIIRDNKVEGWDFNSSQIGTAHGDVSAFDSISFVSRDMMRYVHSIIGHNPNSTNPVKPVISSSGKKAPLLYGKTLFVYAESLDGFFSQNKNVDILTTKSGAKIFNEGAKKEGLDTKLINKGWERFTGAARPGMALGQSKINKIPIDALGLLPSKDKFVETAKIGQSDNNYKTNRESERTYNEEFRPDLDANLDKMSFIAQDPIRIREWVMDGKGDESLLPNASIGEGLSAMNNLVYFASLSRYANPMSFSPDMVKNKMFGKFVNSIINNRRSVTNQFDPDNSHRYGGQAFMVQMPDANSRLKGTLVDADGKRILIGEVLLPAHEKNMSLDVLKDSGFETRLLRGTETLTIETLANEIVDSMPKMKEKVKKQTLEDTIEYLESNTLGGLHEFLKDYNQTSNIEPTTVGVIVNRKPRTRPNDMSILSLKDFLPESAGNAISMNSLDVVNVYEGDYDADKADYLFAAKSSQYEHINRASNFFVQGVDPSSLQTPSNFRFGLTAGDEGDAIRTMAANTDLYKASIGIVQKVPRILGYLNNLGSRNKDNNRRTLLSGENFRIEIDYNNQDFFQRSALETQYIIDGKGKLNENIAEDITSWRRDFLFPRFNDSKPSGEVGDKIGFVNNMRAQGHSNNKRIRIFRKFNKETGQEEGLNRLDRAILTEMINEYSGLLNSTGNSLYENTGNQRPAKYSDVIKAAEKFSNFNQDINSSLYYRLRNRTIDPRAEFPKQWKDDPDFQRKFGVIKGSYKKYNSWGKEIGSKPFSKSTRKVVDNEVFENGVEFSKGQRGAVIDRIVWQVKDADPFNQLNVSSATGEIRGIMDRWYNSLMGGSEENYDRRTDQLLHSIRESSRGKDVGGEKGEQIIYSAKNINKKIAFIGNLKRKIMQIKNDKRMHYKAIEKSVDKLNNIIYELEGEIQKHIENNPKYVKSRKIKDLKRIEYVSVNEADVKEGAIQYATMSQIQKSLPFLQGKNFGLSGKGMAEISEIKKLRQLFYGNRTNLSDVLQFGPEKTALSQDTRQFLANMPTMSQFHQVETALLQKGVNDHGLKFLYAFMNPTPNPNAVGLFNNQPVPIPYGATGRYRRGLALLTKLAKEGEFKRTEDLNPIEGEAIKSHAEEILKINQMVEAHFHRYFNKKFDMREFVGDMESVGLEGGVKFKIDQFRLPDFNESLTGLRGIQWARGKKRIANGMNLMNDNLLAFYRDIMKVAGKEKDFDSYLNKMSEIQDNMLQMNIMNPMEYLAMRSQIEAEVKNIAKETITGDVMQDKSNPTVKKIMANPVYALMGGASHFKGLNLEAPQMSSIKRLTEMTKVYKDLEAHAKDLNFESTSSKNIIEQERIKLKEVCKL